MSGIEKMRSNIQLLLTGVAASGLLGGVAFAQEPVPEAEGEMQEIVVTATPIRDSAARALAEQRKLDRVATIVAADSIGQFPDQNAAASLARLPGVAVQRDQGQERYVQLRGAPNRWTSVAIDGIPLTGADELGVERAFRFDSIPAIVIDTLVVNRSLSPDLPADAVAGQVDLRTADALGRNGWTFAADLGAGRMELGEGDQLRASGRIGWSNGVIGATVAGSHYRREQVTENREFSYDSLGPTDFSFRDYSVERRNNAYSAALAFSPNAEHRVDLKVIYTEFLDAEQRNQYDIQIGRGRGTRSFASGDLVAVPYRLALEDGNYSTENLISTLSGQSVVSGWTVDWRINRTETESVTSVPVLLYSPTAPNQFLAVRYDASTPNFPVLDLATTQITGPGSFARGTELASIPTYPNMLSLFLPLESQIETEAWVYGADAEREFEIAGQMFTLKTGFLVQNRDIVGDSLSFSAPTVLTPLLAQNGISLDPAAYETTNPWPGSFPRGFDAFQYDNDRLGTDLRAARELLIDNGQLPASAGDPTSAFDIEENIQAFFAMAGWEGGGFDIVGGVRVEREDVTISGVTGSAQAGYTPVVRNREATRFFPSLNFKYEVGKDWLLRGALVSGIARPSFGVIRTGASVNDVIGSGTVSGGNPDLRPETTWGFDVASEWYLDESSLLSISAFRRDVKDVIYKSVSTVTDDSFDTNGIDRTGYAYDTYVNGSDGWLQGVEISYQQQWQGLPGVLAGFGFQGNLTLLDGEYTAANGVSADFPGTSDTIVNVALFYEKYGLSTRLGYQWRSDWADALNIAGETTFRDATGSLDFSLTYLVRKGFTVYFEANNLTNETFVAYDGDEQRPVEVEQVGARWIAGLRLNI